MADCTGVVDYPILKRHRDELRESARARRRRLAVAVPVIVALAAGAFWASVPLGLFAAALGSGVAFFVALPGGSSVDPGALAGIEGEVAVLERLKTLPDDYVLFNRVRLPDAQLPNGRRELDFIVVGPTGLWIVEVKNTPGHIYVQPDQRHWPLARRGCCGSQPNWNALENPVHQASAQARALRRWLLQHAIPIEPRPLVCMAHPEASLDNATGSPIPVLLRDAVAEHIKNASPQKLPGAVVPLLAGLHPGRRAAPGRAA